MPGIEGTVVAIDELFVKRGAQTGNERPADLTIDDGRVQECAAIMRADIAVDADIKGDRINLDAAEIEGKAVGQIPVDLAPRVRRVQLRRVPSCAFAYAVLHAFGQHAGRPMRQRGSPVELDEVVGVVAGKDAAISEFNAVGGDIQPRAGDRRQLVAHPHRGSLRCAANGRGKAAGTVAGGNRPGVLFGIHLKVHGDIGRLQTQLIRDDLRQHGGMALPLRHRFRDHVHRAL